MDAFQTNRSLRRALSDAMKLQELDALRHLQSKLEEVEKVRALTLGPMTGAFGALANEGQFRHLQAIAASLEATKVDRLNVAASIQQALGHNEQAALAIQKAMAPLYELSQALDKRLGLFGVVPIGLQGSGRNFDASGFSLSQLVEQYASGTIEHSLITEIENQESGGVDEPSAVAFIANVLRAFAENTMGEFKSMGLFSLLSLLGAIYGLINIVTEQPYEEREDLQEVRSTLEQVRISLEEAARAEMLAEDSLAELPRVRAQRLARLRSEPNRSGVILHHLKRGEDAFLIEKLGRWRRVAYRDPLSEDFMEAWVYSSVVDEIIPPSPVAEMKAKNAGQRTAAGEPVGS